MRRLPLLLAVLIVFLTSACGGKVVAPVAQTVVGTLPQPALPYTELPFFGSPFRCKAATIGNVGPVAFVPITVFGVGDATPWEPQPASTTAPSSAAAISPGRRTGTGL